MKKEKITVYKIKNGDNLSTIANNFNINPTQLLIDNQISPQQIFEGNIIHILKKY